MNTDPTNTTYLDIALDTEHGILPENYEVILDNVEYDISNLDVLHEDYEYLNNIIETISTKRVSNIQKPIPKPKNITPLINQITNPKENELKDITEVKENELKDITEVKENELKDITEVKENELDEEIKEEGEDDEEELDEELSDELRDHIKNVLGDIKIYWINMQSRPDRRVRMENMLDGLNHTRIVAINGNKVSNNEIKEYNKNKLISKDLSKYEIACTLSHLKAIRRMYRDRVDYAIILEDDVNMSNFGSIDFKISDLYTLCESCIQLSIMCSDNRKWYKLRKFSQGKYTETRNYDSLSAYLINREYAGEILDRDLSKITVADDPNHEFIYSTKTLSFNYPLFSLNKTSKKSDINSSNIDYQEKMTKNWHNYINKLKTKLNIDVNTKIQMK